MSSFNRYAELHDPTKDAGPGDHRPTAMQIVEDNDLVGNWNDKVVLVTGCSSGIGIETARAMKATGAKVYVTARDVEKGRRALGDILEPGRCEIIRLKLDSLKSVRECAAEFQSKESKLNILINNAGVMALPERNVTEDGFETQIGTNHFGHFLLFQLLRPQLLAGSTSNFHSRVVSVSSIGHRSATVNLEDINLEKPGAYSPWGGYGNAKTANIWLANEIDRRYGGGDSKAIHANSLMPGGIETGLQTHTPELSDIMKDPDVLKHMKSPEQGAATTVWAAVANEWEGTGGKYLEDCQIAKEIGPSVKTMMDGPGYAPWAFDVEGAKRLWDLSNTAVGFKEE